MSTRSRSAHRRPRLRPLLLGQGARKVTLVAAGLAALLAAVASQGPWQTAGAPLDLRLALGSALGAGGVVAALVWPLVRLLHDVEAARVQLDSAATSDELTGLHNQRHFLVLAEREWARCRRYDMGAALLRLDVDHFRRVNDLHGQLAGDQLLRQIAHAISGTLRQSDLPGRFGGDGFAVFLPHTDTLGALDVAERIRVSVGRIALEGRGEPGGVTLSVGVGTLGNEHDGIAALIADAARALLAAKNAGRNCVRTPAAVDAAALPDVVELPWWGFGPGMR